MDRKAKLYTSGAVAALSSYVFTSIGFTGSLYLGRAALFLIIFLAIMLGFEKFMDWAERFE
jgi:hypothetical protein